MKEAAELTPRVSVAPRTWCYGLTNCLLHKVVGRVLAESEETLWGEGVREDGVHLKICWGNRREIRKRQKN